jgi:hypothetical protein
MAATKSGPSWRFIARLTALRSGIEAGLADVVEEGGTIDAKESNSSLSCTSIDSSTFALYVDGGDDWGEGGGETFSDRGPLGIVPNRLCCSRVR